ncbi:alpha-amylase [Microbacteriaceae bacterium]|nr:alpha-amylase [Candidatus Saccharibacteria bacterium]
MDSTGDGVGDIRGVINRLEYLKGTDTSLGIDAIWFSPIFPSPMADFGYDVSNYNDIDPLFGSLDDFKELLAKAHAKNICVMVDFVPNHTSDQHPWFKESRSSKNNTKSDYYVWRDGKADGSPPNNWLSIFGGSAWEYDKNRKQYYLHTFLKEQPDLDWDNKAVRHEMCKVVRFWLELGVDGIRADAVRWMSKDSQYRDDPKNPKLDPKNKDEFYSLIHKYSRFGPRLFQYLKELTDVVAQFDNRIMIFEDYPDGNYSTKEQYMGFYGVDPSVSMPFNFEGLGAPYDAESFQRLVTEFQGMLNQDIHTPVYCFSNHDNSRIVSRYGREQARLLALLQITLPGIPVVYYGDELGMEDVDIPMNELKDPVELRKPGLGQGRDPERTPMQWDDSVYAGFSEHKPWLPVADTINTINVKKELGEADSYLSLYRRLLGLRNKYEVLRYGDYETFGARDVNVMKFARRLGKNHVYVALNFSDKTQSVEIPHIGRILCCTHPVDYPDVSESTVHLRPHEAVLIECIEHPLD